MQVCQYQVSATPSGSVYWHIQVRRLERVFIDVLIARLLHFFKPTDWISPFDCQKTQNFLLGAVLIAPWTLQLPFSVICTGIFFSPSKSNLLLCHANSPLTLVSWRRTPNKTE